MDRISQKIQGFVKTFTKCYKNSEDVHWIAYRDFKYAEYISPIFEQTWGYSRESILKNSRAWDTYVLSEDLKFYHPLLEMVKRIKEEGPLARYNETYRIIRPDGRIRWILDKGHSLYDKEGEYIGITGVAIDITAIKTCGPLILSGQFACDHNRQRYYLHGRYQKIYLTLS